jgi:four helix bundle protein
VLPRGRVERFEDLVPWQCARALNRDIFALTRRSPVSRDRAFVSQIRRASLSVMSNVAEGFERSGRGEFAQSLVIAKASAGEVRSLLYAAIEAEYIDEQTFLRFKVQVEEVGRIVGGLRSAVARQKQLQYGKETE